MQAWRQQGLRINIGKAIKCERVIFDLRKVCKYGKRMKLNASKEGNTKWTYQEIMILGVIT